MITISDITLNEDSINKLKKYNNIFDTHAHYNDESFCDDMDEVLKKLPQAGICNVINCGTTPKTSSDSLKLAEKYDFVYFAAGIHGLDCSKLSIDEINEIEKLLIHKKCVAVGEIGLDYHYEAESRLTQLEFFERQLIIANGYNLPVIVHDREAHADTLELLKKHHPKGVLHCFSGSVETAKEILNLGMYIGLGGAVTFKNAKKPVEVAKYMPSDRLLLETDCPYMSPVPFRGQRNDSSLIPYTAEFIASIRGTDAQELINITAENAKKLFFNNCE